MPPLKRGENSSKVPLSCSKFWGSSRYTLAFERFLTLMQGGSKSDREGEKTCPSPQFWEEPKIFIDSPDWVIY
jgi:hypothetical protein